MELPRGYISYNQIRLYQQCPQQYYQKYIAGVESPVNDKIFLGIVFHTSVEAHLKKRINGQFSTARDTIAHFDQLFLQEQERYSIVWNNSKTDVKLRGLAILKHYLAEIDPDIDPMLVEEEMEAPIPEIGVTMKGVVDLVERDFSITDFKTSTTRWSKERGQSSFLQMVMYRYLFEQRFGPVTRNLKFRIIYSKSPRNARHQVLTFDVEQADFSQMIKVIDRVVTGIQNDSFCPKPSFRCAYCEFKAHCLGPVSPA